MFLFAHVVFAVSSLFSCVLCVQSMQCEQKEWRQTQLLLDYVASLPPLDAFERFALDDDKAERFAIESKFELRQSNIVPSCVAPFLTQHLTARATNTGLRYYGVLLRNDEYDNMPFGCYTGTQTTQSTQTTQPTLTFTGVMPFTTCHSRQHCTTITCLFICYYVCMQA